MKKFTSYTLMVLFLVFSVSMNAQQSTKSSNNNGNLTVDQNLQKGKSQVFISNLSFAFGNGSVLGNIGLGYGFFIADNHQLRFDFTTTFYSSEFKNYRFMLSYRQYFNTKYSIKPFVQVGGGVTLNSNNEKYSNIGYGEAMGGAVFNVKRFGFELGLKVNYNAFQNNEIYIRPVAGVSFSF